MIQLHSTLMSVVLVVKIIVIRKSKRRIDITV